MFAFCRLVLGVHDRGRGSTLTRFDLPSLQFDERIKHIESFLRLDIAIHYHPHICPTLKVIPGQRSL